MLAEKLNRDQARQRNIWKKLQETRQLIRASSNNEMNFYGLIKKRPVTVSDQNDFESPTKRGEAEEEEEINILERYSRNNFLLFPLKSFHFFQRSSSLKSCAAHTERF